MGKTYKGSEIIRKVENQEIKHFTKIRSNDGDVFIYNADDSTFYWEERVGGERVPVYTFLNHTFELIEDEINIQDIKLFEIDKNDYIQTDLGAFKTRKMDIAFLNKINELIRVTKQLDKKLYKNY